MLKGLEDLILSLKFDFYKKEKVSIIKAENHIQGVDIARIIIYNYVDSDTALFLSGGSTPKELYKVLAKEKYLLVGEAAMVDERFGESFHRNSNEKMIKKSKLISYFHKKGINFSRILDEEFTDLHTTALEYEKKVKGVFLRFPKKIAIMGIGTDGHTASLPASPKLQRGEPATSSHFAKALRDKQEYAVGVEDFPGEFNRRITLTFKALSEMDLLIVLIFGLEKKKALELMFGKEPKDYVPAKFYTKPEIAVKTIVITDQKI